MSMVANDQVHRSRTTVYASAVANKVIVAVNARMVVLEHLRGDITQSIGDDTHHQGPCASMRMCYILTGCPISWLSCCKLRVFLAVSSFSSP